MRDLFREWISENPFLVHDLRRFRRRGLFWKLPLIGAGLPALVLLVLHLVFQLFGVLLEDPHGSRGMLLFSILSLLQVLVWGASTSSTFSLLKEAAADRLAFIRLVPMGRRELLVKIGLARLVIRAYLLLPVIPVYLLLMAYGGLPWQDIGGLFLLLSLYLFAPPGTVEITQALSARQGEVTADPRKQQRQSANSPFFWAWMLFQGFAQVGVRKFLMPFYRVIERRVQLVLGPEIGNLFPISILAGLSRFLWTPQPFYHWIVVPFGLVALYWVVRTAYRLVMLAEMWAREPEVLKQDNGVARVTLPETTWLPDEVRLAERLELVVSLAFYLVWAGFLWTGLMDNGILGSLAGSSTPQGGVAAILMIQVGLTLLVLFERVRGNTLKRIASPAGYGFRWLGILLVRALVVSLCLCALGGISPWPEVPVAFVSVALVGLSSLLFALGWRAVLGAPDGTDGVPAPRKLLSGIRILLWLATYGGPLAILALGDVPDAVHWSFVWSPFYLLLRLFPGLFRSTPPIPFTVCLAVPAGVGLLLWLIRPRRTAEVRSGEATRSRPDPLVAWIARRSAQIDNPLLNLALHRWSRRPTGLMGSLIGGIAMLLIMLGLLGGAMTSALSTRNMTSPWATLMEPAFFGLKLGAFLGLLGAGIAFGVAAMSLLLSLNVMVTNEELMARMQGRRGFLLTSGMTDREFVHGTLLSGLVSAVGIMTGGVLLSLLALLFAVALGASPWWLAVLLWGAVVSAGWSTMSGLLGFRRWQRSTWWERLLRALAAMVIALAFYGAMIGIGVAWNSWISFPFGNPLFWVAEATLISLPLLGLPHSYRRALASVHAARLEDDLERAK